MPVSYRNIYSRMAPWPTAAVDAAPKPVRDAYATHQQLADAADQARRDRDRAQRAFENADRDDHQAAVLATREERPLPPPTKDAKRELRDQAVRAYEARCALANEAEATLIAVAEEHRGEWLEALSPSSEKAVRAALAALDKAEHLVTDAVGMATAYRWLEGGRLARSPGDAIPQDVAAALLSARAVLQQSTPLAIQQAIDTRKAKEEAIAEEMRNSIGGVVVNRRRSLRT